MAATAAFSTDLSALAEAVSQRAMEILLADLTRFGSRVSRDHKAALHQIVTAYSKLTAGLDRGRIAFDLDVGMGKSRSIVAWVAALVELGAPWSVVIAGERVEALADVYRALVEEKRLDAALVGFRHAKRFDPQKVAGARAGKQEVTKDYASVRATGDNEQRPILLVTHERLRGRRDQSTYNVYQGRPRDLVIWDESLIVSSHEALRLDALGGAIGALEGRLRFAEGRHEIAQQAVTYLARALDVLAAEHRRLTSAPEAEPREVRLPEVRGEDLARYRAVVRGLLGDEDAGSVEALNIFLDVATSPLRVVLAQGVGAVVYYKIAVPTDLDRVVVLDASYAIRVLEQLDKTIVRPTGFRGRVKRYDNVTLHHWRRASGRRAVAENLAQPLKLDRTFAREVAHVVKGVPENEAVLIFTFKAKRMKLPGGRKTVLVDFEKALRAALRDAGVRINATVPVEVPDSHGRHGVEQRRRIVFTTWGRETATSDFAYCRHVIFAGVLFRPPEDLCGAVIGQLDNLVAPINTAKVRDVGLSEAVHSVFQAAGRSALRVVQDGQALRADLWLPMYDQRAVSLLTEPMHAGAPPAMPGLRVVPWEPAIEDPRGFGVETATEMILETLVALPGDVDEITLGDLKQRAGLDRCPPSTWKRARDNALERQQVWFRPPTLNARVLVRMLPIGTDEAA